MLGACPDERAFNSRHQQAGEGACPSEIAQTAVGRDQLNHLCEKVLCRAAYLAVGGEKNV